MTRFAFALGELGVLASLSASMAACQGEGSSPTPPNQNMEAGACAVSMPDAGASSHAVLTQHNDNARTGATLTETVLDTCNVSALTNLGSYALDGEVYAEPLYAEQVVTASGKKNLLVVATMADSLFAFDADVPGSDPVWQLGRESELGMAALSSRNIGDKNGILATPVIDPDAARIYLVSRDCDPNYPPEMPHCQQRLFAIELASGKILENVSIAGSVPSPSTNLPVFFDPSLHWSRASLLLAQGKVFVSFGSGPNGGAHEEDFTYHGWLFGYSTSDLTLAPSVYCSTPDFGGGAIWQSGNGPAADDSAIYFATGNGIHQPTPATPADFPATPQADEDSLVRLPLGNPAISAHFWDDRPYHADGDVFQYMEKNDIDLSTAGPLLIPESTQLIAGGKSGILYVLDRATLKLTQDPLEAFTAPPLAAGQTKYIYSYDGGPHVQGSPVFFRPNAAGASNPEGLLFYWPELERLKSFGYDYGSGVVSELQSADVPMVTSGGALSLSASGGEASSAIVWASTIDSDGASGHLWAFSAVTLGRLWDATLPAWSKFAVPLIAAGRVYMASTSSKAGSAQTVQVFGLSR
ncbi:MAG TPA: hypothetical protein VHV51_04585 [Polyangiaceae bacterium]|nr:hypothetical protein [Polyangiaceae bacterium]